MATKRNQGAKLSRGILADLSGEAGFIVIQKNGVIRAKPLHIKKYSKKAK
jgi:hypothetical protein